jgi:multicomponent Na+:H+ antiporter subunit G
MLLNITIILLLICGLVFYTGGAVGIIRFPDFYSRLHPAGKLDTAGLVTTMGALAIYSVGSFSPAALTTALKIILIVVFVFITSPTAIHAIVDAAVRAGVKPWSKRVITKYDLGD